MLIYPNDSQKPSSLFLNTRPGYLTIKHAYVDGNKYNSMYAIHHLTSLQTCFSPGSLPQLTANQANLPAPLYRQSSLSTPTDSTT